MSRIRILAFLAVMLAVALPLAFAQDGGVLRVSLSSDPTSLFMPRTADRTASNASWPLYDGLVAIDDDGEVVPVLATDWTVSDDGTEYVFTLREGVVFHDGQPFTSADVVATWETGMDETNDYASRFTMAESVEAIDDYTVRIVTPEPNAVFLTTLANDWAIVPHQYITEVGLDAFAANPIGTGAFKFVSRVPGDRIVYERNDDYWREGLPYLDGIEFRVIPDASTRMAAIQTGSVDIANRLTSEQVEVLERDPNVNVVSYLNDRVYYVAFKNIGAGAGTPLEDSLVRQALNYGTDRFGINQAVFAGQANAAPGFVVEGNLGYDADMMAPFPYDPERARELLAEAGYPDGFDIVMGCPADGYININEVCQAVASSLGRIGVNVEVDFQTTTTFWSEARYAVTGPMYVDSWSSEMGEALPRLEGALVSGNYYNTWEDPRFDDLIAAIQREVDRDARAELYQEMHRLMVEEPPFIYLYQPVIFEAARANVENYRPRPAEDYYLDEVRFND